MKRDELEAMFKHDIVKVADMIPNSSVDGPGIRVVIFMQGCGHHCKGCHNPNTHDFEGGKHVSLLEIYDYIHENTLGKKVTFSGGDPTYQWKELYPLVKILHEEGFNIWWYTGFTLAELEALSKDDTRIFYEFVPKLTDLVSMLVDGPYIESLRTLEAPFRGSSNQNLIATAIS